MAYQDNNNVIFKKDLQINETNILTFSMEENKNSGLMKANVREFKHTEAYDGPTKNGIILNLHTVEDVDKFQKQFNEFFDEIKKMM